MLKIMEKDTTLIIMHGVTSKKFKTQLVLAYSHHNKS